MKITTTYDVTPADITNLVVSALEGGYSPWLHKFELVENHGILRRGECWYGQDEVFANPFIITATFDDPGLEEGNGRKSLTFCHADVFEALQKMAQKAPHHFRNIVDDNTDAITGDVFMQFVLLGEIVYG